MSKNAILKTISLTQIGRKKFYRTAITFDMSVTCSFIGIKVQRKSEIRKKNEHLYSLYTKILEERIQTGQYR